MPIGIDFIQLPFFRLKIPFNLLHITCIFTILIGNTVATFWFYIREVKTFSDLSESVFWGSRSVLSLVLYIMFIRLKTELIQFFDRLDEIVCARKCFLKKNYSRDFSSCCKLANTFVIVISKIRQSKCYFTWNLPNDRSSINHHATIHQCVHIYCSSNTVCHSNCL